MCLLVQLALRDRKVVLTLLTVRLLSARVIHTSGAQLDSQVCSKTIDLSPEDRVSPGVDLATVRVALRLPRLS